MKRILVTATIVLITCVGAKANAFHLNPALKGSPLNMPTYGETTIPIGHHKYCLKYSDRCSLPLGDSRIRVTSELWNKIVRVNERINQEIKPLTDREIYGVDERWEYPKQVGDCEDYALLKRKQLNYAGIPLGALLMTVARDADGGGHAVLTVVTDRGDFILDNVENRVLPWQEAELTYLKRQSSRDSRRWESLQPN